MTSLDGYRKLAAAIVLQAFKDYCVLAHKCRKHPNNKEVYIQEMRKIVEFAKSEWYTDLTKIPQRVFLAKLKEVMDIDES